MVFTWSWFRTNWNRSFPNKKCLFYLRGLWNNYRVTKETISPTPARAISLYFKLHKWGKSFIELCLGHKDLTNSGNVKIILSREREKPWESNSFVCCIYWCIRAKIPLYDCVIYDSLAREGFTEAGWIFYCVSKGKKINDFLSLQSDRSARKDFKKTAVTPSDFHPRS